MRVQPESFMVEGPRVNELTGTLKWGGEEEEEGVYVCVRERGRERCR